MRWGKALFTVALLAVAGSGRGQSTALDDYLATQGTSIEAPVEVPATPALPASAWQGALLIGHAEPGATASVDGRPVRVSDNGSFVFGVGRDASASIVVVTQTAAGANTEHRIVVIPRQWPIERVDGVPPKTINPPPAIAQRIQREQAMVVAARERDDARDDYEQRFIWPVHGRISGRFGNTRVYNGQSCSGQPGPGQASSTQARSIQAGSMQVSSGQGCPGHSGMDIAVAQGTPVHAPAAGVITLSDPDLYLTGGTVLLDHGHGVSSNFLHLSRIDVKPGDHVQRGQVLGAVGATGRATGPHLHWGMNWFQVRVDPLLLLDRTAAQDWENNADP